MKLFLLLLLVSSALSYHYLTSRKLTLATVPSSIYYLSDELLVTQTGRDVTVYNTSTSTEQPIQSFTTDTDNAELQVSPQTGRVLLLNNKSIFQIQDAKQPQVLSLPAEQINWVFGFGAIDNILISHSISSKGSKQYITYMDITNESSYVTYINQDAGATVVAGSNVAAMSPQEFYFASSGVCEGSSSQEVFFLFESDSKGFANTFNFTVPGCVYQFDALHKQEWELSTISIGGLDRWHSFTYVLDELNNPRVYTTQIVAKVAGQTFEATRFDTKRLIGIDFLNKQLYTADELLCRITYHSVQNYTKANTSTSAFPADVVKNIVARDQSYILGLTNTNKVYLFTIQIEGTFILSQTITNVDGAIFTDGFFANQSFIILKGTDNGLYLYDYVGRKWGNSTVSNVIDFCSTSGSYIFAVTRVGAGESYVLRSLYVQDVGADVELVQNSNRNLTYTVDQMVCFGDYKVLLNPILEAEPIQTWHYTTVFSQIDTLIKEPTTHYRAYHTGSLFFFTNTDNHTTPQFYTQKLVRVSITGSIVVAPTNMYKFTRTFGNDLFFSVSDDLTDLVAMDYYELVGTTLHYRGSYPLTNNGVANSERIIILPTDRQVSVDYFNGLVTNTVSYHMTEPPQQMRGLFYDQTLLDCNGYTNALFRKNNFTNTTEMVVINGLADTPVIEKYQLGTTATLLGSAVIQDFVYTKLTAEMSADQQNILIYGIKKTSTLSDVIQIRSAANLKDIIFQKKYFEETDVEDIQSYTLLKNNVFATIINTNVSTTPFTELHNDPNSGNKVSTGELGDIVMFSACDACSFVAAIGANLQQVNLVNVNSGNLIKTIDAGCDVKLLSLNSDGTLIAHMCVNGSIYVFNTQTDIMTYQTSKYPTATEIKVLSTKDLIVTQGGNVYHVSLLSQKKDSRRRLVKKDVINADIKPVVDYNAGTYATITDPSVVQFSNFQGQSIDSFPLSAGQQVVAMAFTPSGLISLATNQNNLITLTPIDCASNSSTVDGFCTCNPTFDGQNESCFCADSYLYKNSRCECQDGKYAQSVTLCEDCSSFCSTCSDSGLSGCDAYGALFIVMIIVIVLLVVGGIIFAFWFYRRKKAKKNSLYTKDDKSSDIMGQEPLMADDKE